MKKGKTIATLVLLLAAAASVFFIGWVQIRVPRGHYALLVSKTGGWDGTLREPGIFLWRWEALLPTNLSVHSYKLGSVSERFTASGSLPNADLYAAFLQERPSFAYSISGRLSAAASKERLPALIKSRALLDQKALDSWLVEEAARVGSRIVNLVSAQSGDVEFNQVLSKGGKALEEDLLSRLKPEFPDLVLESLSIDSSKTPDYAVYAEARKLYLSYLGTKAGVIAPVMKEIAEAAARDEYERESLAKYGELLDKYPVLVDFMAIRKGLPPAPKAVDGGK